MRKEEQLRHSDTPLKTNYSQNNCSTYGFQEKPNRREPINVVVPVPHQVMWLDTVIRLPTYFLSSSVPIAVLLAGIELAFFCAIARLVSLSWLYVGFAGLRLLAIATNTIGIGIFCFSAFLEPTTGDTIARCFALSLICYATATLWLNRGPMSA